MNRFSSRVFGLDAARATLMLLGLVVHAGSLAASYQVPDNSQADNFVIGMSIFAHNFRMPAFFMISGIFAAMLISTRGVESFWNQRKRRLLYVLLAGSISIVPLTYLASGLAIASPLDLMSNGFLHLWFVYYLLIFSIALIAVELLLKSTSCSVAGNQQRALGVWLVNPISLGLFAWLSLITPDWFDPTANALTHNSSLFPPIGILVFYAAFFAFGVLAYRYWTSTQLWIKRFTFVYLIIGVAAFINYAIHLWGGEHLLDPRLSYAIASWMLSVATIGLFLLFMNRQNSVIRYLSASSYWVYLIHLPIMFAVQRLFATWHLGVAISFWFSLPAVFAVAIATYHWGVRGRLIGKFLAGRL